MAAENRKLYAFPGKFKSQVWNCFGFYMDDNGKLDRSKAICRMCFRAIAYSGNTTNLHNHVSHHHPQAYGLHGSTVPAVRMAPLTKYYNVIPDNSNSADGNSLVKSEIDKLSAGPSPAQCSYTVQSALLDFLINDIEPMQTLDSPTFHGLLKACGLKQDCPPSEYFTNFLLDCYGETRQKVLHIVSNAKSAYLKLDVLKSFTTETYILIVSAQVLHSQMKVDSFVLQTFKLPEEFDATWIAGCISGNIFSEWNIPENTTILSSDFPELRSIGKELNCVNVTCLMDRIKEAVEGCLRMPVIKELFTHARKLTHQFTENRSNMNLLQEKQTLLNLPHMKLKLDTKSSWMSSYEMLESLQTQAAAVYSVLKDPLFMSDDDDVRLLSSSEQTLMQSLLTILKSLALASSVVSEMSYLSAAVILPILKKLETTLKVLDVDSRVVVDVKNDLWTKLSDRYSADNTRDFLLICSVTDPRYKDLKFVEPEDRERANTLLKIEMTQIASEQSVSDDPSASASAGTSADPTESIIKLEPLEEQELSVGACEWSHSESPAPAKKQKSALKEVQSPSYADCSWLDDVVHDKLPTEKSDDSVSLELTRYEKEKQILAYNSPLAWWNERRFIYPVLSQVAMKYLSAPAVIKVKDARQELIEWKQQCIAPEMIEYMVFLNANYFKTRGPSWRMEIWL